MQSKMSILKVDRRQKVYITKLSLIVYLNPKGGKLLVLAELSSSPILEFRGGSPERDGGGDRTNGNQCV